MKKYRSSALSKYVATIRRNKAKVITGGLLAGLLILCLVSLNEKKSYPLLPTQSKELKNSPTKFVSAGEQINGHTIISDNTDIVVDYKASSIYAPANGTITTEELADCFSYSMPSLSSRLKLCKQQAGSILEPITNAAGGAYKGDAAKCQTIFKVKGPIRVSLLTNTNQPVDGKLVNLESYVTLNVKKQKLDEIQQIQMDNAVPLTEFILSNGTPPCK